MVRVLLLGLRVFRISVPELHTHGYSSAEAVAGMITAELSHSQWEVPDWLPKHYLTTNRR